MLNEQQMNRVYGVLQEMFDDDNGVGEATYNAACRLLESLGMSDEAWWLAHNVKATDDRFYLKEGEKFLD